MSFKLDPPVHYLIVLLNYILTKISEIVSNRHFWFYWQLLLPGGSYTTFKFPLLKERSFMSAHQIYALT